MRVLLINSNMKDDVFAAPPIGLCYVAEATEAAGHEVKVLDLCFRGNVFSELKKTIQCFTPDVIGVSVRNIDNCNMLHPRSYLADVKGIVDRIRELTGVPLVLGGSGASLSPAGVLEKVNGDFIVVSEGERAFVELLSALGKGESPDRIPGVGTMSSGEFRLTPPRLDEFASGKAEVGKWIDMGPYKRMGSKCNIQTKRGCRHKCIYCTYNQVLEGNRLRLRSPVDVVDELEEAVVKYGQQSFEFVDSVFNDPIDHCSQILDEILTRPWKARFTAMGVSPKGLDKGFLELMWRAGFASFWITPESASETMIHNYQKGFDFDDVVRAAEATNRTRFNVVWDFLVGGPGETNETLQETLDFVLKYLNGRSRPPFHVVNFFVGLRIYPSTRLWEISLEEGFVSENSDPLDRLWYLSEGMDLERAIDQMIQAAKLCPGIISGFDEKYLGLSGAAAWLGRLMGIPDLYLRLIRIINSLVRKQALRFTFRPPEVAAMLLSQLERQGYRGKLLDKP